MRDARIAMIDEGANGIQALDLVGRKLPKDGGRAITSFFNEVSSFVKENGADEAMKPYVAPLGASVQHLQQATMWLMQNAMAKPDNAAAASTDYLHLFGLVALAYMRAMYGRGHAGQDGKCRRAALSQVEARDRKILHGTCAAGNIDAPCANPGGAASMMELPAEAF